MVSPFFLSMLDPSYFLLVFGSVFIITDPFANIPIFQGLLQRFEKKAHNEMIRKACIVAFAAFFLFSFLGPFLFSYLQIEFFSFKIAGGLLLLVIAGEMLLGFKTRTEITPSEQEQAEEKENLAVTPMGIPLITGPGAITTGIVLLSKAHGNFETVQFVIASALALLLTTILLLQSERITKFFSPIGMKIATRIMGLLLMSLAVQFIVIGLKESGLFLAL